VRTDTWEEHGDGHLGIRGQRLLGLDALPPQPCQAAKHVRVVDVERIPSGTVLLSTKHVVYVGEDSFVEVCATELLKTVGRAQQGERARAGLAHHSRIEGTAT
jgi:hypothetical protein